MLIHRLDIRAALAGLAGGLALAGCGGAPGEEPAADRLALGLFDEAQAIGQPETAFPLFAELRPQVLRVNLRWDQVALTQPADASDHTDPAYDWSKYDALAERAAAAGIELLLHVFGTPGWANGGLGPNHAPTDMQALEDFARAAATRLAGVSRWAAWNEPNLSLFLAPSWAKVDGERIPVSARVYAEMCNATREGVHAAAAEGATRKTVACGVTSPRGRGGDSVHPIRFLRELHRAGAEFDVYAHHAYARRPDVSPSTPPQDRFAVSLANIDELLTELDRLYGDDVPLWITEYGYETDPPDDNLGVPWDVQAEWMEEAYELAAANPRIELLVWFLLRDEPDKNGGEFGVTGWQSGLVTVDGKRKPAFDRFAELAAR